MSTGLTNKRKAPTKKRQTTKRHRRKVGSRKGKKSYRTWTKNIRQSKLNKSTNFFVNGESNGDVPQRSEPLKSTHRVITKADPYNWLLKTSPYATTSVSESTFDRRAVSLKELCLRKIADNALHLDRETLEELDDGNRILKDIWKKVLQYRCDSYATFMNFAMKCHKEDWFGCWLEDLSLYPISMFLGLKREIHRFDQRHRVIPLFDDLTFHRFVNNLNWYELDANESMVQVVELRKKISKEDLEYLLANARYLKCLNLGSMNPEVVNSQFIYTLCQYLKNGKLPLLQMVSLPGIEETQLVELQNVSKCCSLRYIEISSDRYLNLRRNWSTVDYKHWTVLDDFTPLPGANTVTEDSELLANHNSSDSWGIKVSRFMKHLQRTSNSNNRPLVIHYILTSVKLNLDLETTSLDTSFEEYDQLWDSRSYETSSKGFLAPKVFHSAVYLSDLDGLISSEEEKEKENRSTKAMMDPKKNIAFIGIKKTPLIRRRLNMNTYFD